MFENHPVTSDFANYASEHGNPLKFVVRRNRNGVLGRCIRFIAKSLIYLNIYRNSRKLCFFVENKNKQKKTHFHPPKNRNFIFVCFQLKIILIYSKTLFQFQTLVEPNREKACLRRRATTDWLSY